MELKYQLLISKGEKIGIEGVKNSKAFTDYSQKNYDYSQKNEEDYKLEMKKKFVNRVWWYDSRYGS